MAAETMLLLAVTKMQTGLCVAGMTTEPDPVTRLRWVRPVRDYGHILLGDLTLPVPPSPDLRPPERVIQTFDVVQFPLHRPRPDPPHIEDWTADFTHQRPQLLRRLEGQRRADFLAHHLDSDPRQVLDRQERSLCLVEPDQVSGSFLLDAYTGQLEARLSFHLGHRSYRGSRTGSGLTVTDLKWRALGRSWLPAEGGGLDWDGADLQARLGVERIYLAVGLTRKFQGAFWPLIVGVHTVPDYAIDIDYDNL